MKLAYVTPYNVLNKANWSSQYQHQAGIYVAGYYLAKAFTENSVFIDYISHLKNKKPLTIAVKRRIYEHLLRKKYYSWADPLILKNQAGQISSQLSRLDSDLVFSPTNVVPLGYIECNQPIVLWTDTTLYSLIDYYYYMSNLCEETIRNVQAMEIAALNRCKLAIYTSEWAAQTAIKIYGIAPCKVKVVPWGANIECDRTTDDIYSMLKSRPSNICKLLFIGVDWIRKGGNIALEVAKELNKTGLKTELTIAGGQPPINEPLPDFVKSLGYINKSTQEGLNKINNLLADSHFLILPSQAECYGHVLCEANSFGVPCISTDVGGIPTVIKDDVNGKLFSKEASIAEYCTYISNLFSDPARYRTLALSSFNEYQTRLNWSVAVRTAKKLLMDLI